MLIAHKCKHVHPFNDCQFKIKNEKHVLEVNNGELHEFIYIEFCPFCGDILE